MRRTHLPPLLALALLAACARDQADDARGTVVIAVGEQAQLPVPVLKAVRNRVADNEVADLMFLRLAALKPDGATSGDSGFEPELAAAGTGGTR